MEKRPTQERLTELAKVKRRKTGGRQVGTKNHPRETIVAIPPSCNKCGAKILVESVIKERIGRFFHVGVTYTKTVWRRGKCSQCDQRQIVRYLEGPIG